MVFRIRAWLRALPQCNPVRRAARAAGVALAIAGLIAGLVLTAPVAAYAAAGPVREGVPAHLAVADLPTVIGNLQAWLMGILAALATLFLVLAGVYWSTAGGDPAQVDKAKAALKNALVGYGLAVLAPTLLAIVKGIVGG